MKAPYIYLLPCRSWRREDTRAAIQLLRGAYNVIQGRFAPMGIGFVYQTETAIADTDMEVLGLVPWE